MVSPWWRCNYWIQLTPLLYLVSGQVVPGHITVAIGYISHITLHAYLAPSPTVPLRMDVLVLYTFLAFINNVSEGKPKCFGDL